MRYPIRWNKDSKTLTLEKEGTDGDTKTKTAVGELMFDAVGEVSSPVVHPAPKQHLIAMAVKGGEEDFSLVTVKNETGNDTLDYLEQEPNETRAKSRETFEANRVKPARGGPATDEQRKAIVDGDDDAVDVDSDTHAADQTLERLGEKKGKKTGGDTA